MQWLKMSCIAFTLCQDNGLGYDEYETWNDEAHVWTTGTAGDRVLRDILRFYVLFYKQCEEINTSLVSVRSRSSQGMISYSAQRGNRFSDCVLGYQRTWIRCEANILQKVYVTGSGAFLK